MRLAKRGASVLLAVITLAIVGTAAIAWDHGYRVYAVRSGSMSPAYLTGSLVVDVPPQVDGSTPGSVITFNVGDGLVTHRVYATSDAGVTTKGDANRTPDSWTVPPQFVVGQVVGSVPRMGYILVFFKQPAGVIAVVTGLVTMMLLWQLFFPEVADELVPTAISA